MTEGFDVRCGRCGWTYHANPIKGSAFLLRCPQCGSFDDQDDVEEHDD